MTQKKLVNILLSRPRQWDHPSVPAAIEKIKSVSPRIHLTDVSELVGAEMAGDFSKKSELDALLSEAEIYFGPFPPKDLVPRSPKLKWIQSPLAGVDFYLTPDTVESPVVLTTSVGIHGTQVGEMALAHMLMLAKKAPVLFTSKGEKRWQSFVPGLLYSRTVGILGFGTIGQEIGRFAKTLKMNVLALDQPSGRFLKSKSTGLPRYADALFLPGQLKEVLARSDYVVITLPLTPATTKLIGEEELRSMKPSAYLVNVSRGGIVDEEALIRALSENRIAGAGLDVFAKEPLPVESKLWDLPNVIITPHFGGQREDYFILAGDLFCKNLVRYLKGRPLMNTVDKKRGY
jgi:phosphoglycerate dehydrogenase-like enzyme